MTVLQLELELGFDVSLEIQRGIDITENLLRPPIRLQVHNRLLIGKLERQFGKQSIDNLHALSNTPRLCAHIIASTENGAQRRIVVDHIVIITESNEGAHKLQWHIS